MNLDIRIISRDINEMLWKSKKTLSTAESCTSGRVATVLTATPGSSEYYLGGIVCYADKVKEELLGVDQQLIETKTSVCEEVVKQLVLGSNKLFHSDYAVAVSGYAGPGGGTPEIPVGTIWIAVGNEDVAGRVYSILKMYDQKHISIYIAPDVLSTKWNKIIKEGCSPHEIRYECSEED